MVLTHSDLDPQLQPVDLRAAAAAVTVDQLIPLLQLDGEGAIVLVLSYQVCDIIINQKERSVDVHLPVKPCSFAEQKRVISVITMTYQRIQVFQITQAWR